MRWVGPDLHKRYITACALDDAGQVVAEHRRLPPDVDALVAWFAGLGEAVTVAMEATLYWAWLHDQLRAAGIAAVAAHPYQDRTLSISRRCRRFCSSRCDTIQEASSGPASPEVREKCSSRRN